MKIIYPWQLIVFILLITVTTAMTRPSTRIRSQDGFRINIEEDTTQEHIFVSLNQQSIDQIEPTLLSHTTTISDCILLPPEEPPFSTSGWTTDFTRHTVPWSEIGSGGPPKDGIPSLNTPIFESIEDAKSWLSDQHPIIVVQHDGEARGYPLSILMWHEIVSDTVGGMPVTITFDPLTYGSAVFKRELDDTTYDFGTTGKLRFSSNIMYDRQTESWWQPFNGKGIVGERATAHLTSIPSQIVSLATFTDVYTDSLVLSNETGFRRDYGRNPYSGYSSTSRPFLFRGELDDRLPAMARVVGVMMDMQIIAFPFSTLETAKVINHELGNIPFVVFHQEGTVDALDASAIDASRDIGSVAVFNRQLGDQTLTFQVTNEGQFQDIETESIWTITGGAIEGSLTGETLGPVTYLEPFWFAWAAFYPATGIYSDISPLPGMDNQIWLPIVSNN